MERKNTPKIEQEKEPEWDTKIILARHGAYDNYWPKTKAEADNRPSLGGLTEEGVEQTKLRAKEYFEQLMETTGAIDVVFLHSPTLWLDLYRPRAKETSAVLLGEMQSLIKRNKVPDDKLRILTDPDFEEGMMPVKELKEADIFYIEDAKEPRKYIQALRAKFGDTDWWEEYYNIAKEFEDVREEVGAESPVDIAKRLKSILELVALYRKISHQKENPDRKLVVFLISHGEVLRSFVQHGLKAGKDSIGFGAEYNQDIELDISSDDKIRTNLNGKDLNLDLDNYFLKTQK